MAKTPSFAPSRFRRYELATRCLATVSPAFATHALGAPSAGPNQTSVAMPRMVRVSGMTVTRVRSE